MTVIELAPPVHEKSIFYPDSDGKPMADNTKQFRYITTIQGNLAILYENDPNVVVFGDLLWYPVEGAPSIRAAPDVMVVFGRPKGDRGSYRQWEEDGLAPQVVFEVLSPGNRKEEMDDKLAFYERYGVEEYYLYDPDRGRLQGWWRKRGRLQPIASMNGWRSPRLGIRFELVGKELDLFDPDGARFLSYVELGQARQEAEARVQRAEARAQYAEARAEAEAQARIQETQARTEAEARLRELEAKLREAGLHEF